MEKKPLELDITFGAIAPQTVGIFRQLNQTVFPVKYNNKFYEDIILTPEKFTKFEFFLAIIGITISGLAIIAYLNGIVIGAISCRIESMDHEGRDKIYIMTLGVLEPYRHYRTGTKLLESVLAECVNDHSIGEIYLHVQTSNTKAIAFYQRFGFQITDTIVNYYKDIDPPNCYILKKIFER